MPIKTNKAVKTLLCLSFIMLVSACVVNRDVKEAIQTDTENINAVRDRVGTGGGSSYSVDTIAMKDDIWLGDKSSKILDGDPLPGRFETDDGITLISSREVNLMEIAEMITSLTGIPVKIDDMIVERVREDLTSTSTDEDTLTASKSKYSTTLMYTGKLSRLLDQLSTRFNFWWRHRNGIIELYETETRVFMVYALPVSTIANMEIGGTSASSGGDSSGSSRTSASLSSSVDTSLWAQIQSSIQGIIPETATMSIAPASGSVTVTASPAALRRVSKFIRELNAKLSRQVAISVRVLQVTLNDSDNYGLDLNALFSSGDFEFNFVGPFTVDPTNHGGGSMSVIDGDFAGTKAIVEALSKKGKVSVVTSSSVTTINNKVAPVQIAKTISYIDSMTTTSNGAGIEPTVSVEQAKLNVGFTMEVLPRILDHGRIMMMFAMTITELTQMSTIDLSAGNKIQQPEVESRGFIQEIAMKSGSTLVLTGFEKTMNSQNQQGVGFAENPIGGNTASERERNVLVILITPQVLVSPLSPETRVSGI